MIVRVSACSSEKTDCWSRSFFEMARYLVDRYIRHFLVGQLFTKIMTVKSGI